MRKLCVLLTMTVATSMLTASAVRAADEPKDNQASKVAKDSNYRYHNGQWWYWMPQQKNWKVWNGSQWSDYRPGATRSFSYADDGAVQSTGTSYSQGYAGFPDSVSNSQIMGSYGFRSAGSKAEGRY